ncbi:LacI family DNA-binding transcriptional regulator [Actinoplanes sp. URMC 104]|uniref:LacI family DNA-binding transcriptional regulator n=1 Tax=Actinoplanes sp. URMC 104 TaxID=3423409 RepID=UPI003F1D03E5
MNGERLTRPTMRDVAARVGVSQALVSLVFRGAPGASRATRDRVLQAAAELGYRPNAAAQVLRRTRSRHLGVLFTLRQPFDVDLVEALHPAAERYGYHVVLGALGAGRDERRAVEELLANRCEAMILLGPATAAAQLAMAAEGLPVVDIARRSAGEGVDVVRIADEQGARLAVEHLIGLGHRSIVHVDGDGLPGSVHRRRGYEQTMRQGGLADRIRVLPGDHTEESGAAAVRDLLAGGDLPTAIFAGNDRCAHGVLGTLLRAGLNVPGDVSVVGFDDSGVARLSFIDLTTVRQEVTRMAEAAVEAVVERLDRGRIDAREIVLEPALVIRSTTGVPRRTPEIV